MSERGLLEENIDLKNAKTIGIVPGINSKEQIEILYAMVNEICTESSIFILEPCEVACRLKSRNFDFYILLTVECPFHSFKKSIQLNKKIYTGELTNVILDSLSTRGSITKNIDERDFINKIIDVSEERRSTVITESQKFYNYFARVSECAVISSSKSIEEMDRMRFLISRLSVIDKIKSRSVFGIFFSSLEYEPLADRIADFLHLQGKEAVEVYMKDISWERLIGFEHFEVLVVIDCPFHAKFNIDIHLPVTTPFELAQSFKVTWKGDYDINLFNVEDIQTSDIHTKEVPSSRNTQMILRANTYDLEYDVANCETAILEGLSGNPRNYE